MDTSPTPDPTAVAQGVAAPQHGPRPLPLFLNILWRQSEGDQRLRERALVGLRRYQDAIRPAAQPIPAASASAGTARLRHYGTENGRAPILFVPSLINPPQILDLSSSRSVLREMRAAGHDVWLVDWGTPTREDAAMGLSGHVTDRLLPLIAAMPRAPIIVGYCLGGTLALGAAMLHDAHALVTIASPWAFDQFAPDDQDQVASLWHRAKRMCEHLGYVPMEVLQSGFWAMDPARTIRKYAAFADMDVTSDEALAFLAVEDWANGGPPLTYAAGRDLFDELYGADASGQGRWMVGNQCVDPARLTCPGLSISSTVDRIVPAAVGVKLAESWSMALGHVGMVVGGRARDMLWKPLSRWLFSHGG